MAVKTQKRQLTGKQRMWLKYYLDSSNKETFLNKKASARAAGYRCKNDQDYGRIGFENSKKLHFQITEWLESEGLGETSLKTLLVEGLTAEGTKIFSFNGQVTEKINVPAWETRRRYLEMAFKITGLLNSQHAETSGGPVYVDVVGSEAEPESPQATAARRQGRQIIRVVDPNAEIFDDG